MLKNHINALAWLIIMMNNAKLGCKIDLVHLPIGSFTNIYYVALNDTWIGCIVSAKVVAFWWFVIIGSYLSHTKWIDDYVMDLKPQW